MQGSLHHRMRGLYYHEEFMLAPRTPEELASALADCAAAGKSIAIQGVGSKRQMGGPLQPTAETISTAALDRVLQYEPNDLTISVEAGMPWNALTALLDKNNQMIPLDPVRAAEATVGGVLAANTSGPRRRQFGSVRDAVIGMSFATLEGKLVRSGGMVVKNVAGLDMAKLLIGSFGTLAAIATVNFKLTPRPPASRTFLHRSASLAGAIAFRDRILASVLQPTAIDLLNPHAAALFGHEDWVVATQTGGSEKMVERWSRELPEAVALSGEAERTFWSRVQEFAPEFMSKNPTGSVVRVSVALQELGRVMEAIPVPAVARAGNGVVHAAFPDVEAAARWLGERPWPGVLEWIPPRACSPEEQWPRPGNDLAAMEKVKSLFDPNGLLNRGRLYGRI